MTSLALAARWATHPGANRAMIVQPDARGVRVSLCCMGREMGIGVAATVEDACHAALVEAEGCVS